MEFPKGAKTTSLNSKFCLQLANHILQENAANGSKNALISPLSFHLLLSLIAVGSKGQTLEQLLQFLGPKSLEDLNLVASQMISVASSANESNSSTVGDPDLLLANGVWVCKGLKLKTSFLELMEEVYNANAKEVDFVNKANQIVAEINAWAETATKGLIKNLLKADSLDSITQNTSLILANALYFKGTWTQPFHASSTKNRVFHLLNGQTVRVPFMTNLGYDQYLYGSFDGYKVLKLPYKNSQPNKKFVMYIFLPNARKGLKEMMEIFESDPEYFNKIYLSYERFDDFWIPKFKFWFEFEATKVLLQLGLNLPFDRTNAEITQMVDSAGTLFVSKVFQKCFIEVNEEGTEAAACSVAMMAMNCGRREIPSFVADHPFMFMIKEEISGVVFFAGAVLNPMLDS